MQIFVYAFEYVIVFTATDHGTMTVRIVQADANIIARIVNMQGNSIIICEVVYVQTDKQCAETAQCRREYLFSVTFVQNVNAKKYSGGECCPNQYARQMRVINCKGNGSDLAADKQYVMQ